MTYVTTWLTSFPTSRGLLLLEIVVPASCVFCPSYDESIGSCIFHVVTPLHFSSVRMIFCTFVVAWYDQRTEQCVDNAWTMQRGNLPTWSLRRRRKRAWKITTFEHSVLLRWVYCLFSTIFGQHLSVNPHFKDVNISPINSYDGPICSTIQEYKEYLSLQELLSLLIEQFFHMTGWFDALFHVSSILRRISIMEPPWRPPK